jgi:signal transduction histidine kinase
MDQGIDQRITQRNENLARETPLISPDGTPAFQEIPLKEFSTENGYHPLKFFAYLSKNNIAIFYQDKNYYLYAIENDKVKFLDITGFIYVQMELVQLLAFWGICFMILVYLISLYFVKSSLKNLKKLTHFAQELDLDTLSTTITIKGHKYDEIRVIAEAFNASLERIHTQILALKDFIANASHELKTPLMMIHSEIDIALKKKHYEEHLLNVKQHIKRVSALLDILSLITRLESKKHLEKEAVPLRKLTEFCLQKSAKDGKPSVSLEMDKELIVQAQPLFLEIVLKNLIENAKKYAGEQATITVVGTATSLSVEDNGVGIAPEYLDKIFERFWQLEKTEGEGHSFGLGLYLVKKIVQLHGWTIRVESTVGKGTKFIIAW